jgi:hypothetical protein
MKHVPIDMGAAEDRLRACDAIHTALDVLLKSAEESSSDALLDAMRIQLEYLHQELESLRAILHLSGETFVDPTNGKAVPAFSPERLCACEAMRKLKEKGL